MLCQFCGFECEVRFAQYENGNLAIQLVDAEDGAPVAKATVNPGFKASPVGVLLKTWSENQGIDQALIDAGVVGECMATTPCGFAEAQVHILTDEGAAEMERQLPELASVAPQP